jgi:hypothetical protein
MLAILPPLRSVPDEWRHGSRNPVRAQASSGTGLGTSDQIVTATGGPIAAETSLTLEVLGRERDLDAVGNADDQSNEHVGESVVPTSWAHQLDSRVAASGARPGSPPRSQSRTDPHERNSMVRWL